jgi:putative copper resistance protein D
VGAFLSAWSFDVFIAVNLVAAAALYLWGTRHLQDPSLPWSRVSTACFVAGVASLAVAYLGPLPAWSHTFFWAHMASHLIVMMVAAPLLVLGSPVYLWFRASSAATRRRIVVPVLRSRLAGVLTNPVVTWVLFAGTLLLTHFTPFYNWALENHDADLFIEQPLFLIVALLYYWPVTARDLLPRHPSATHRVISMSVMMIPEAIVGAVIYFAPVVLYSAFLRANRPFGPDPMTDQHLAGGLMWALVMVVEAFWMMWIATEFFKNEEKRTHRVDAEIRARRAG